MHIRLVPVLLALAVLPVAAQERSPKAIAGGNKPIWKEVPDKADCRTATFLGGPGTEYLCGGGFQPDGTIVVVGNTLGPTFTLGTAPVAVLGADAAAPGEPTFASDGRTKDVPSWRHANATGFIARLSPDAKRVLSVVRFPWKSAAITSAIVDEKDGSICIAGRVGSGVAVLGGQQGELPAVAVPEEGARPPKSTTCDHHFVAKLSADVGKVLWLRTRKAPSECPTLMRRGSDGVALGTGDLIVLDGAGTVVSAVGVPGGIRDQASVSPIDGAIAIGGEYNSPTGREPYRNPTLNIHDASGRRRVHLYDWTGPYVGLDNSRLVSDSAVRQVSFDAKGNLTLIGWSDGGNSAMLCQPTDMRRSVGRTGLGLNAAGANATSFAYIVRLEPKNWQVIGWTMWTSKYAGRANGAGVDVLTTGADGSVVISGGSAWGCIQTPNRISDDAAEPGGRYVAVLSPDMTRLRFSTVLPGVNAAHVQHDNFAALASGLQQGKPRALLFAGAGKESEVYGWTSPTPVKEAMQPQFAGGLSDGYLMVIDLPGSEGPDEEANGAKEEAVEDAPPAIVKRLTPMAQAQPIGRGGVKPALEDVTVSCAPNHPKYVSVDAEIRDVAGRRWASFLCGKPLAAGTVVIKDGAVSGTLKVGCDRTLQVGGDQDRRTIGELVKDRSGPPLTLEIASFGAPKLEELPGTDKKGKPQPKYVVVTPAQAVLTLGGSRVETTVQVTISAKHNRDTKAITLIQFNAYVTLKGKQLGLATLADEDVDVRVGWVGLPGALPVEGEGGRKKKR